MIFLLALVVSISIFFAAVTQPEDRVYGAYVGAVIGCAFYFIWNWMGNA